MINDWHQLEHSTAAILGQKHLYSIDWSNVVRSQNHQLDIYTSEWHMPNVGVSFLMTKSHNKQDQVVPDL